MSRTWRLEVSALGFAMVLLLPGAAAALTTVNQWQQEAKLVDSPGAASENLGQVLAVSQDGSTIAAERQTGNFVDVFVEPAGGWAGNLIPAATLDPGNGFPGLGWSVAVSDDGGTIAAGAPFFNGASFDEGAIFIYLRPAGGWSGKVPASAKLTPSDANTDINLGLSVVLGGDTVFAGFPEHRIGSHSSQGAVYVFVHPAAGWKDATQDAKLTDPRGFFLSHTLAVSEDGSTVVAGSSPGAFVFERPPGGWTNISTGARLIAEHGAAAGFVSVGISGDAIVEGSASEKIGANTNQGAAYVYVRPSGGWTGDVRSVAELTASDGIANDALGTSVAIAGNRVFAGAPAAKIATHAGQGAAYVFDMPQAGWSGDIVQSAKLVSSDGAAADQFGGALGAALAGQTLVAGAPGANVNGHAQQGAVYVFGLPAPPFGVIPIAAGSLARVGTRR